MLPIVEFFDVEDMLAFHANNAFVRTAYRLTLDALTFYFSNVDSPEYWIVFVLPKGAEFSFDCDKHFFVGGLRNATFAITCLDEKAKAKAKSKQNDR